MLWINGTLTDNSEASFNLADRGLLLADGLFETILAVDGRAILLDEHLKRLARGAAELGIPCDIARVRQAVADLITAKPGDASIRVTLTRGPGNRGLLPPLEATPTLFASRADWSPAVAFTAPSLATSRIRRNTTSPLSRLKSLSYLDNILALREAQNQGADDALLLSTEGAIACTSAANIFIVEGETLVTAPVSLGVLDGITRGLILVAAPSLGLETREEAFDMERLTAADGVFLTNSLRLVMRPPSLDGRALSTRGKRVIDRIEGLMRWTLWPGAHTHA